MAHEMHLSDLVEIVTDRFSSLGAPRGTIGVIVDDWADGSNDVDVSDRVTGEVIAHFRAAEDEIRPYAGPIIVREPRKHGILFGRGDELGTGVDGAHAEEADVAGEIPWELRDEPPSGPIFH